jgi:hypothetical protein
VDAVLEDAVIGDPTTAGPALLKIVDELQAAALSGVRLTGSRPGAD